MLATNLETVDLMHLRSICENRWSESPSLEFKRVIPGNSDKDKHELLKDVCAFANADGGDLVFGINEKDGVASGLAPITGEATDTLMRRINQIIESGIEPRLLGIQMKHVSFDVGYVLILRVPPSYLGPHSIRVNNSRRFVIRTGTITSDLTFDQLRAAFDRTASLGDQARSFIQNRIAVISNRKTPKPLISGPVSAIHFIPIAGLARRQAPELQGLYNQRFTSLLEPDWGGGNRLFNLDGLVVYPGGDPKEGHYGYTQIFRNGAIEAASLTGRIHQEHTDGPQKKIIWSLQMTKFFRERTATFLSFAREQGLSGPAILNFSLLHVEGHELGIDRYYISTRSAPISDRPHLIAPEIWVDNLEITSVDEVVRPLLDTLWQGFGLLRCLDYDAETGEFKPRRS